MPFHDRRRSLRVGSLLRMGVVLHALLLGSCASDGPEMAELRGTIPPMSVLLLLDVPEGLYGSREDWLDDLFLCFEELGLFTSLVSEGEDLGGRADTRTDMRLELRLEPQEPVEPQIDGQAASLNFLAWSTVPPAAWWIRDVRVDPGVEVTMRWSRNTAIATSEMDMFAETREAKPGVDEIMTSLLDRNPALSWSSLGTIILPPFVYRGFQREHLTRAIAQRVRLGTGRAVAARLLGDSWPDELLTDFEVVRRDSGLELRCTAARTGKFHVWIEGHREGTEEKRIDSPDDVQSIFVPLDEGTASPGTTPTLRVVAIDRAGAVFRYSVPLRSPEPTP